MSDESPVNPRFNPRKVVIQKISVNTVLKGF